LPENQTKGSLREQYEAAKAEVVRLSTLPVGDEKFLRALARRDALLDATLLVEVVPNPA
jgi:hypothetical protein